MNGLEERCTVGLWRGYVSALFYARPVERDVAMLVSSTFRTWQLPWRKRVALCDDPAAKESLRALEEMLAARGWEKMRPGAGADWYELQFRRNEHADAHRKEPSAARSNGVRSRARLAQPGKNQAATATPRASTTSSYNGARASAAPSEAASAAVRPRPAGRRRASRA